MPCTRVRLRKSLNTEADVIKRRVSQPIYIGTMGANGLSGCQNHEIWGADVFSQLTYEQRCQIEVLNRRGFTQKFIADAVGMSQSTISRELKRNTGERGYCHRQAQRKTSARRCGKSGGTTRFPDKNYRLNKSSPSP